MNKYVELEQDLTGVADAEQRLPELFRLPVSDKTKADKVAKKIRDKDKTKTFKQRDVGI